MNRELVISIPDSCDDEWLRSQLRGLHSRLESLSEELDFNDDGNTKVAVECLTIVQALQEYAGY